MAINDDTAAVVAAQLTAAWATRMGTAGPDEIGAVGPSLLRVYHVFKDDLQRTAAEKDAAQTDAWLAALKKQ